MSVGVVSMGVCERNDRSRDEGRGATPPIYTYIYLGQESHVVFLRGILEICIHFRLQVNLDICTQFYNYRHLRFRTYLWYKESL